MKGLLDLLCHLLNIGKVPPLLLIAHVPQATNLQISCKQ